MDVLGYTEGFIQYVSAVFCITLDCGPAEKERHFGVKNYTTHVKGNSYFVFKNI